MNNPEITLINEIISKGTTKNIPAIITGLENALILAQKQNRIFKAIRHRHEDLKSLKEFVACNSEIDTESFYHLNRDYEEVQRIFNEGNIFSSTGLRYDFSSFKDPGKYGLFALPLGTGSIDPKGNTYLYVGTYVQTEDSYAGDTWEAQVIGINLKFYRVLESSESGYRFNSDALFRMGQARYCNKSKIDLKEWEWPFKRRIAA